MRILSLAPSNTEILYTLGLGDQIIGTTSYCDYPSDATTKPKIGSWIIQTAKEIKKLKPDLIFTCYYLPPELREWKGPGEIVHIEPRTLNDIYLSILTIGNKTGTKARAEDVIKKMQADIAELKAENKNSERKKLQKDPSSSLRAKRNEARQSLRLLRRSTPRNDKPKVYMEEWPSPPMVSGNWVPELVRIAGGIPILAKRGQPSGEFPFHVLERENPDIMIFHWCGFGERWNKNLVLARPGWTDLKAVKNNNLFVIDDSLINRPGPRIAEGVKEIQKFLR